MKRKLLARPSARSGIIVFIQNVAKTNTAPT
jgi:hypothetical protein